MPRKPDPELLDDEAPEATDAWFKGARPASEVLPSLVGSANAAELLQPRRGRPPAAQTKTHINVRLDADVLAAFKNTGPGWQTRLNDALREWLHGRA